MKTKTRVLIVDDSALIRLLLKEILDGDPEIEVIATAEDPIEAREKIKRYNPDVITLDVEMPKMDGITFLRNLMRLRPMPVVMISTLTAAGADVTLKALELGAFDYICKPSADIKNSLADYADDIIEKVKGAARSNVRAAMQPQKIATATPVSTNDLYEVIAIGASTGGTEAIKQVLKALPVGLPPIVMTQHIPAAFSTSFAKRLDSESDINVFEVTSPMELEPGCAYLAPGDKHLFVRRQSGRLMGSLLTSEKVNRHRPAVDVLFQSLADTCGKKVVCALLTGMGADGAAGMLDIRNSGGFTIAQDEASSVVWGMPGAAVAMNAAMKVLPLSKVPAGIIRAISR
ncbi:chemotaxis response regulator protein-glutamate methylesterase [Pleionea sp. CnH1-48]|uniref:protein-glutamate methylesterase/protein-glutamine glutaminase n=1 Tax=Pleionea sp. CnH1-48 TaxID=2954494 RepID=UPI002096E678|nr:chemotaxis response regulator protein-glutamate methylesterase [Pleionea sp. CnH1-48]MCO7226114.1 chemotaxis response regulator protein-glutamate methylesterase [Pleionea sp. CnH1-48]